MKYFARSALSLGLFAVFSTASFASGLVLADNEFRNDLAWLSDRGTLALSLSTAQWLCVPMVIIGAFVLRQSKRST